MNLTTETISFSLLRSGDKHEMERFFKEYFPHYVVFASKYIVNEDVCEDIAQESFLNFWENRKKFINIFFAKSYLYKLVKNKSLNYLRHQKIEKIHSDNHSAELLRHGDDQYFIESIIEQEVVSQLIRNEIDKLPEMRQRVISLAMEGMSNSEIADELNIAINTVKTHKSRTYEQLRDSLSFIK